MKRCRFHWLESGVQPIARHVRAANSRNREPNEYQLRVRLRAFVSACNADGCASQREAVWRTRVTRSPTFCRRTRRCAPRNSDINWITARHKRFNGAARAAKGSPEYCAFNAFIRITSEMDTREKGERPRQGTKSTQTGPWASSGLSSQYFFVYSSSPDGETSTRYFQRFPSRAGGPAFSLLSKCAEFDYAVVGGTRCGSRKTTCRSFSDIGYSISATRRIYRIILVISRLIRAENTRWKSTAVMRPRFRVICMHGCETVLPRIQNMPRKYSTLRVCERERQKWSADNTRFAYEYLGNIPRFPLWGRKKRYVLCPL